ncbi:lactonase family protein [Acidaminococcus fermentans]|jgi:6-phosphogluconolactonase|uniref:lactonase family protein n=1 Tax=Acidaminococcus fermentans TaxID=905 RepID=UPI002431A3C3|nr:lactonase family protein [Acidaminococcus fermentans]
MFAYIGSRTTKERKALGEGITVWAREGAAWEKIQTVSCGPNPSYLCLNGSQDRLYAIHGDYSEVTAFQAGEDGRLTQLNTVPTYGTNPVHLVVSPNGKSLYVANLETGSLARLTLEKDGSLGGVQQVIFVPGQPGHGYVSHPHQVCLHPDGKWLLVPCQGRDHGVGKVAVYAIDPEDNHLTEAFVWTARKGAEPRHVAVHPNGRWVYLVNEKDSTAIFFHFDEGTGTLEPRQMLTTLPEDYFGPGWASGIVMERSGKAVYVSNRTHDTVTVFTIDPETGRLAFRQNLPTEGNQPRFLDLEPDGKRLVAANELTHTVTVFDVQPDGSLEREKNQIREGSPVCVIWKE